MQKDSPTYTLLFALVVCLVLGVCLALVNEGLRPRKELNESVDVKENILKAVHLVNPLKKNIKPKELLRIYRAKIEEKVINQNGKIVEGMTPGQISEGSKKYPLYIYRENGKTISYCIPIVGPGLWSTIYGYLALESDAATVRGITFYKHGETPGLGAQIETQGFQNRFRGKKIWDPVTNALRPPVVLNQRGRELNPQNTPFSVDAITGATMTCNAVTELVAHWLKIYEPFFKKVRDSR